MPVKALVSSVIVSLLILLTVSAMSGIDIPIDVGSTAVTVRAIGSDGTDTGNQLQLASFARNPAAAILTRQQPSKAS